MTRVRLIGAPRGLLSWIILKYLKCSVLTLTIKTETSTFLFITRFPMTFIFQSARTICFIQTFQDLTRINIRRPPRSRWNSLPIKDFCWVAIFVSYLPTLEMETGLSRGQELIWGCFSVSHSKTTRNSERAWF